MAIRTHKLYLPALSIVAVVFLLLILIGISTHQNMDREEKRFVEFVHRQGLTLIHALEAGARAGLGMPMTPEDTVSALLREMMKHDEVAYIRIVPSASGEERTSYPAEGYRIRETEDGLRIFELLKRFEPFAGEAVDSLQGMDRKSERMVMLGLKMTAFEEARRSDLHHAVIMAAILVTLGSGTFFFLFVIQNYYLVGKTLKQTQDYNRLVVSSMAGGLVSIDRAGRVASYNRLALDFLGIGESEFRGADLRNFVDFDISGIDRTLSDCGPVLDREIDYPRPGGDRIPLAVSASPIRGENGRCSGAVVMLRDLTELKRLEERVRRSEKLAAVGALAAGVAHEIRNPLSSIRGFAQFLCHALKDRPQDREYARVMVREVDRINRVVTDLLSFARPMKTQMAPTDLSDVIDHTIRLVEPDARAKRINFRRSVSPDLKEISIDANQITQALLNLLLNAAQAVNPDGVIEVGAGLHPDRSRLFIRVEDDGPGIPPDAIKRIFDPFFTTREEGTGLGLAIVHKIVENHHGEIKVESPPSGRPRGARFTIEIPMKKS